MIKLAIAKLRKEKGITQNELAEYLGVTFQSVSKWENEVAMPDITLLPLIASYFDVTTDEILGLKNDKYIYRNTNSANYWNEKMEYLKSTRYDMLNDDYLEFLITKVWKINKKINIVDFGCGYGSLGMKLLPLLPIGSSYTGIDISSDMIKEANLIFKDNEYKTTFIQSDVNKYEIKNKYDIAICHAFLRHLPNPKEVLSKMIDSVKTSGMVICIEVNRVIENAGLYIHNQEYNPMKKSLLLDKLWKTELESEGRDFSIGQKLPCYMRELGLKGIGVRINDSVSYINPDGKDYDNLYNSFTSSIELSKPYFKEQQEKTVGLFMNRGLKRSEAEMYVKCENDMRNYINNNDEVEIVKTLGLLISYGIKE